MDGPVAVPSCASVQTFGNGASCDVAGAVDLKVCGDLSLAACSPGRLCYSGAQALACTCAADADCAGRTSYVNTARAAAGQPPLTSRCVAGLCAGDLDLAEPAPPVEQ
ncbi:MAG: hypothetical protein AMXMBFR64_49560 [Myxococcales bacterium]